MIPEKDKQAVLCFIARRMRSEQETRDYLKKRLLDEAIIDELINYLYDYQYLNDEQFAIAFIHDKLNFHPCSRQKLMYDLKQKGISSFLIDEVMDSEYPVSLEKEILLKEARKYYRPSKTIEQMKRHFYQKGYKIDSIEAIDFNDL